MSLKSTFGKLISEYVADVQPEATTNDPAPPLPKRPVTISPPATAIASVPASGVVDEQFVDKLRGKLKATPQQQTLDQFYGVVESLQEFIPDEGSRFRAALKQLQKGGVDAGTITDAYNGLTNVLESEVEKFSGAVSHQRDAEIAARERQIEAINQNIQVKEAEMRTLMDQRDAIAAEIVDKKTRIDTTENNFGGAVTFVRREVEDALRKLKLYLPTTAPAGVTK